MCLKWKAMNFKHTFIYIDISFHIYIQVNLSTCTCTWDECIKVDLY